MRHNLNVLALLQFPPPVHGAALRNVDFIESNIVKNMCKISHVEIQTARDLSDIGGASFSKILTTVRIFYNVIRNIFIFKPDVTYITLSSSGYAYYKDVALILFSLLLGVPVVCHMRNRGLNNQIESSLFRSVQLRILSKCSYIVMSNSLAIDVRSVSVNPFVVSNCLAVGSRDISEAKLRDRIDRPKIVFLSNVSREKGIITFLLMIDSLRKMDYELYSRCSFEVYGPFSCSEERDEYMNFVKKLSLGRVKYFGAIYGEKKYDMLSESAIMVFPTEYAKECFPGVIMESFSCSLPVISRNTAAVSEIIDDAVNGYVLDDDPDEYAQKVVEILNGAYIDYARNAKMKYDSTMSHKIVHRDICTVLRRVASK